MVNNGQNNPILFTMSKCFIDTFWYLKSVHYIFVSLCVYAGYTTGN